MAVPILKATFWERMQAVIIDTAALAMLLFLTGILLPDGPPPVDAMSYFTARDFRNYFTLVALALALIAAFALIQPARGPFRRTPGQIAIGLLLVQPDGSPPTRWQLQQRVWRWGLAVLVVFVPGPVIALVVGVTAAMIAQLPFTTTDRILRDWGAPHGLRVFLNSLSFLALAVGLWWISKRPTLAWFRRLDDKPSFLDRESGTIYVIEKR